MTRIIVCAGGTGGHVFPALELCEQLNSIGYKSLFLTDSRGKRFCYKSTVSCQVIPEISCRVKSVCRSIFNSIRIVVALNHSWKKEKPAAVVGFGGIITILPLLIAKMMNIPAIVHEQNSVLGNANKFLSKLGFYITSNFDLKNIRTIATPVRTDVQKNAASVYEPFTDGRFVISIIGGSQGASIFSKIIPLAIELLPLKIRRILTVVQQTEKDNISNLSEHYNKLEVKSNILSFIHDMGNVLKSSSLVVCRAGASTINELATIGRPAILVPYPHAVANHQLKNAEYVENFGAAWVIKEKDLTPKLLASKIEDFIYSRDQLSLAAVNMLRCRKPTANTQLKICVVNKITGDQK